MTHTSTGANTHTHTSTDRLTDTHTHTYKVSGIQRQNAHIYSPCQYYNYICSFLGDKVYRTMHTEMTKTTTTTAYTTWSPACVCVYCHQESDPLLGDKPGRLLVRFSLEFSWNCVHKPQKAHGEYDEMGFSGWGRLWGGCETSRESIQSSHKPCARLRMCNYYDEKKEDAAVSLRLL